MLGDDLEQPRDTETQSDGRQEAASNSLVAAGDELQAHGLRLAEGAPLRLWATRQDWGSWGLLAGLSRPSLGVIYEQLRAATAAKSEQTQPLWAHASGARSVSGLRPELVGGRRDNWRRLQRWQTRAHKQPYAQAELQRCVFAWGPTCAADKKSPLALRAALFVTSPRGLSGAAANALPAASRIEQLRQLGAQPKLVPSGLWTTFHRRIPADLARRCLSSLCRAGGLSSPPSGCLEKAGGPASCKARRQPSSCGREYKNDRNLIGAPGGSATVASSLWPAHRATALADSLGLSAGRGQPVCSQARPTQAKPQLIQLSADNKSIPITHDERRLCTLDANGILVLPPLACHSLARRSIVARSARLKSGGLNWGTIAVGCKYERGEWSNKCDEGKRVRVDRLVGALDSAGPTCKPLRKVTKECGRTCHYAKSGE